MCSDSQATGRFHKTTNAKKIYRLDKLGPALAGGAGDPAYISMLVTDFQRHRPLTISNVKKLVGKNFEIYAERERKVDNELSLALVVALMEKDQPRIYRITEVGAYEKILHGRRGYTTIGDGALWANWLMERFYATHMSIDSLKELLAYIVLSVEAAATSVGGPLQMATLELLKGEWKAEHVLPDELSDMTDKVKQRDALLRIFWHQSSQDPEFEASLFKKAEKQAENLED